MGLDFTGMQMTDGTEYRVLMEHEELIPAINSALSTGELLTLPMGMYRPGNPKTVNPSQVVSLTDYSGA